MRRYEKEGSFAARFCRNIFSTTSAAGSSFRVHGYAARAYSVPQVDRRLLYALICRRCFWWGIFTARLSLGAVAAPTVRSRPLLSRFTLRSLFPLFPWRRHGFSMAGKSNGSGSLFPRQKPQPKFEINNAPACPNRIPYRNRVIHGWRSFCNGDKPCRSVYRSARNRLTP